MKPVPANCLLAAIFGWLSPVQGGAAQERPPNLIVIMTDDQGYADMGFNGCKDIPTPNIDSIASNGVKFTDGYMTYAVCSAQLYNIKGDLGETKILASSGAVRLDQ